MSLLQLILKQLRQRSLSTVLTILSVTLGVALAMAILIFYRESGRVFGQSEFGYDLLYGPKGSKLQLALNNVYQVSDAQGTIDYHVYTDLSTRLQDDVKWAMPISMGDNFRGRRILATQPKLIETPELTKLRSDIVDSWKVIRPICIAISGTAPTITQFPLPANATELPQLLTLQQNAMLWSNPAGEFDPEAKISLLRTSISAGKLIDLLCTSNDKSSVIEATKALRQDFASALVLLNGPVELRPGKPFEMAEGKPFAPDKFQCVVGSDAAEKLKLKLGDNIKAEHGTSVATEEGHEHAEHWEVVGILQPTHTAFDQVILIPLVTFYGISEHSDALEQMYKNLEKVKTDDKATTPLADAKHHEHEDHYTMDGDKVVLTLEKEKWKLSSIFVNSRGGASASRLMWDAQNTPAAMAVNPAGEMRDFFSTFLKGFSITLLVLAILVSVVSAVSILVSIYNSISSRKREIAILRALGATRSKILTIICMEAALVGLFGSIIGLLLGLAMAAVGSVTMERLMGEGINWLTFDLPMMLYFAGVLVLSLLAGLVPALKAYSTPVANNLVAE